MAGELANVRLDRARLQSASQPLEDEARARCTRGPRETKATIRTSPRKPRDASASAVNSRGEVVWRWVFGTVQLMGTSSSSYIVLHVKRVKRVLHRWYTAHIRLVALDAEPR